MSEAEKQEITEQLKNPLSMFDVKGQTAIVTGASGAFGRGIAITLGALGANLVLASGSEDELKVVADEVREVGGQAEIIVRHFKRDWDSLFDSNC